MERKHEELERKQQELERVKGEEGELVRIVEMINELVAVCGIPILSHPEYESESSNCPRNES